MRRRLLISTLAVAVSAVVLFGLPLVFVMIRLQLTAAQQQVERDATTVARTLQNRVTSGLPADMADAADAARSLPDRFVSIRRDGRRAVTFGTAEPRASAIIGRAVTKDFRVIVETDTTVEQAGITEGLGLIGAIALLAMLVAVALAMIQAKRLTRPLQELAHAADRLGSGDARPLGNRYGIAELDRVAEGLDGSAQRISELLTAEREFASDASHQLRSPLTALSMRLEEMIAAADQPGVVREEGAAALHQTERLAAVVSELLGRSRRPVGRTPVEVSVDDAVAQQVVEWEPAFRRVNRKLEIVGQKNLAARASAGAVSQVVATLLDNALVHGDGSVTIRTSQTARSVVIEVRDEGGGVPPDLAPHIFERYVSGKQGGTGLGLALAQSIVAADGGKIVLVRPQPAVFGVFLPRADADETEPPVVSGPA